MMSRDAIGGANNTADDGRDAANHRTDAGAGPRLTVKSPRSTVEPFREDVEALTTQSYPHRRDARSCQRPSRLWT